MTELTFDIILEKIRKNEPFSYARYGDGEWNAILQKKPGGRNCDGHEYFPDLGLRLFEILESEPQYYLGLQRLASEQNIGDIRFDRLVAKNKWVDNEIMHRASIKGRMNEFFDAIKDRYVILVGNIALRRLHFYAESIAIPDKNCWLEYERVKANIAHLVRPGAIVLYCASMMSEVLIDEFKDCNLIQIDCGSVFDPYVGVNSRSYHSNLKLG